MSRYTALSFGVAASVMVIAGCAGGEPPAGEAESAPPIPVDEYEPPEWNLEERDIVASGDTVFLRKPLAEFGGTQAEGILAFGNVNGAAVDDEGTVWIADDMAATVIRVDVESRDAGVVVRRGRGPGEVIYARMLGWTKSGIAVVDPRQERVVVVDPEGRESRTVVTLRESAGVLGGRFMVGLGPDDEYVFIPGWDGTTQGGFGYEPDVPGWVPMTAVRVMVQDSGEEPEVLYSADLPDFYFDGSSFRRDPFSNGWDVEVVNDTVVIVGVTAGDIVLASTDRELLVALQENGAGGTEVTEEVLAGFRVGFEAASDRVRSRYATLEDVERRGLPARMPTFDRVIASSDGIIWTRRKAEMFATDWTGWSVMTLDGEQLGTALVSAGEQVIAASSRYVVTGGADEFNVDVVRVYANPLPRR